MKIPKTLQPLVDDGLVDGVLLMELVTDADGAAAPRLNELELSSEQARQFHDLLIKDVARPANSPLISSSLAISRAAIRRQTWRAS